MYFFWKRGPLFKSLKRYHVYMYVYICVRHEENIFGSNWKKMSVMLLYWHTFLELTKLRLTLEIVARIFLPIFDENKCCSSFCTWKTDADPNLHRICI